MLLNKEAISHNADILGLLKVVTGLISGNNSLFFYCGLLKDTYKWFLTWSILQEIIQHTSGTLHFKISSNIHSESSYLLTVKMIMQKQRLGCGIQYFLLLACQKTLVICICFDILIRVLICYISLPWKAVFKSVFNIVPLRLCTLSCILQIIFVDVLLLI